MIKRQIIKRKQRSKANIDNNDLNVGDLDPTIVRDIEEAQCDALLKNIETVHPNMESINKMINITADFIKDNKRIVYGGTAIEAYLTAKGINFEKPPDKYIDYDFYTPNNEQDSIIIANLFQEAGFKYARRVMAIHPSTYRVSAEFTKEFIADCTFVPESVYKLLPKCEINGIYFIDPQFLKIDLYTSVSNPHTNVFRWSKSYKRLTQLEELYPLPPSHIPKGIAEIDVKTALVIEKYTKRNDNIIICGTQAYNLYLSTVNDKEIKKTGQQPVNYYSFYSLEPEKEAKKLEKKIKVVDKNVKIAKYHPFLDIFTNSVKVLDKNDNILAEFYDIHNDCLSITEINGYKCVNYHWLLRFLYGKYNLYKLDIINKNNKEIINYYLFMIQNLMKAYNFYENDNILHKRDINNVFRILQIDCVKNKEFIVSGNKNRNWGEINYKPDINKKSDKEIKKIVSNYENNLLSEKVF